MTREVSRRTSGPPEWVGGVRPDVVGLKDLGPGIVRDEPDVIALQDAQALDRYLGTLDASEGPGMSPSQRKQSNDGTLPMPRNLPGRTPNGG